jgi:very-short-patch-repair endonuclease
VRGVLSLKTQNKSLTKALRHNATEAEKKLWYHLRNRKVLGAKFRRQQSFGPYILDFYCAELKLAVELDGGQHGGTKGIIRDEQRDEYLKQEGVIVLRFWNNQLFDEFEGVLDMIYTTLKGQTPHPNPLPQGERERSSTTRECAEGSAQPSSPRGREGHLKANSH